MKKEGSVIRMTKGGRSNNKQTRKRGRKIIPKYTNETEARAYREGLSKFTLSAQLAHLKKYQQDKRDMTSKAREYIQEEIDKLKAPEK